MHYPSGSRKVIDTWLTTLATNDNNLAAIQAASPLEASDFPKAAWQSFSNFYQAEWFFRIWVNEEVQTSREALLLCGDFEIKWTYVTVAATKVWGKAFGDDVIHWKKQLLPDYGGFINVNLMWDRSLSTRRQAPVLWLLHVGKHFCATDARDKVFARIHHHVKQHHADLAWAKSMTITSPVVPSEVFSDPIRFLE